VKSSLAGLLFAVLCVGSALADDIESRPNILLIIGDDMGTETLSC